MTQKPVAELTKTEISPRILNEFIRILYERNSKVIIKNPIISLKVLLASAKLVQDNYYMKKFWIFEIEDNSVKNIFRSPVFSDHAKERLRSRFDLKNHKDLLIAALDIIKGRKLTSRETAKLKIGILEDGDDAILNKNRVYIIRNKKVVTTVLKFE